MVTQPLERWAASKETLSRVETWAWRSHQASASAPGGAGSAAPAAAATVEEGASTVEEGDAPGAPAQSRLAGQRGKTIYGNWTPTGSALHDAVNTGNLTAARAELTGGASTEVLNQGYNETPLHRAAILGHVAIVAELLSKHANVTAKRSDLQYKCRFVSEFSIENAEIMENCPRKTMILGLKMATYFAIRGSGGFSVLQSVYIKIMILQ